MSRPEHQFSELQKLLGCKRYEQPPPGYFLSFSDQVIARIEAEDAAAYSSWWSWFVDRFDAKPVLVCAYGLAVSGLLFMGFRLSQVFESELTAAPAVGGPWLAAGPGSSLFLSHDLTQSALGAGADAGFLTDSKWSLRGEAVQFLPAGTSLQLQPVSFIPRSH